MSLSVGDGVAGVVGAGVVGVTVPPLEPALPVPDELPEVLTVPDVPAVLPGTTVPPELLPEVFPCAVPVCAPAVPSPDGVTVEGGRAEENTLPCFITVSGSLLPALYFIGSYI